MGERGLHEGRNQPWLTLPETLLGISLTAVWRAGLRDAEESQPRLQCLSSTVFALRVEYSMTAMLQWTSISCVQWRKFCLAYTDAFWLCCELSEWPCDSAFRAGT